MMWCDGGGMCCVCCVDWWVVCGGWGGGGLFARKNICERTSKENVGGAYTWGVAYMREATV